MATKFSVWIDTPSTSTDGNMQSYTDFAMDSQRKSGFENGTLISSVRVNTALREATLFATGFMKAFLDDSTLDATATVAQMATAIQGAVTTKKYVDDSIASAVTTVLNTAI